MGFFEVISTSSAHIYHSALPLCPRQSIVRSLYEPHARPLARIVHGLPDSWESSIAATTFPSSIHTAVWSPCSRFIAVSWGKKIEVLDAVTLERVTTLDPPGRRTSYLVFSPNARLLTQHSHDPSGWITWDLQTGGLVSTFAVEESKHSVPYLSATYSACGTMFATFCCIDSTLTISIYNVLSGTPIRSYSGYGRSQNKVWAHGGCLRFATIESGSITTEEIGFASGHRPTEVESLPVPDNFDPSRPYRFHPTSSRLAFNTKGLVMVWNGHDSRFLLESMDVKDCMIMSTSFSSDGRSLAYKTWNQEIHLWKESPTGYTLHRKFISDVSDFEPLVSPNGESIIAFGGSAIQLWHTIHSITPLSHVSTPTLRRSWNVFTVGFSSDEVLAAVARMGDETVMILDLKSSISRLTIDTGMEVYAVGVAGSAVVVVGEGKIVTWSLPAGNDVLNPRANFNDSVLTTTFNHPPVHSWKCMSVSPNLRHIAVGRWGASVRSSHLHLYDVHTGQSLASVRPGLRGHPWFTLDGREVQYGGIYNHVERWEITEDSGSNTTRLERLSRIEPPGGLPHQSLCGYKVTGSWWVLSPSGKRLLWLPPSWRSDLWHRMWSGRFLALLGSELPEPVILEFGK
ncbi:hypothetical protein BDM02DRAFT_2987144 [Thelephora ganbajun]|uniref:Uncharacterized protein n=1 Tax=Thelephora ganbajun TaxID=370292 RepID=A0ACB6ZA64_THEGA|nr:hypothetical protein BDM02DRAFT_2987144 [Thelephora ganbajun]